MRINVTVQCLASTRGTISALPWPTSEASTHAANIDVRFGSLCQVSLCISSGMLRPHGGLLPLEDLPDFGFEASWRPQRSAVGRLSGSPWPWKFWLEPRYIRIAMKSVKREAVSDFCCSIAAYATTVLLGDWKLYGGDDVRWRAV